VRFLELQVDNFGPLKNLQCEMHSDVFVVVGHNEAGKSSFHAALETILYGFEFSSREKHPLAQFRSGDDLEVRAKVQLDDQSTLSVRRVLMTQGKLEILDADGQVQHSSSNNEPLPVMQSVPRSLFQAVYSLTANDTDMQKDDVRVHIRELLLGETGLRGARPISTVRSEVERDMQALWRADLRGIPLSKDLTHKLKQAKKDKRAAKEIDRELREAKREFECLGLERDANQTRLIELRTQLEELSFHREWRAYQAKQASVDLIDTRLVNGPQEWTPEALSNPAELEKKLESIAKQLVGPRDRLTRPTQGMSADQALCLEREAAIETVLGQISDRKDLLRTQSLAQQGLLECTRALDECLHRMGAKNDARKTLGAFPVGTLQADADHWDANLEQFEVDSMEREASPYWILGAVVGVAGVVAQGVHLGPSWAALGATLLGFGLAIVCFLRPTRPSLHDPRPELPENSAELLKSLGLQDKSPRTPQLLSRIADQLAEGQRHLSEARKHLQTKKGALGNLETLEGEWRQLAETLGLTSTGMEALPSEFRQALKRAEQAKQYVKEDAHEREMAAGQCKVLQPQWDACEQKIEIARALLTTAFPDLADLNQAFAAWSELGRKRTSAEDDWVRLQASPSYRAGHEIPASGEAGSSHSDPQELRLAIEALEETTKVQSVRLGALEERLASDRTAHFARAGERVVELEAQLQDTQKSRDQLALLGRVLQTAEARYREKNEPDVLSKAGEYLREISQGRYTALVYPAGEDGNPNEGCLQVLSVTDGLRDVAKPLSRGTQEQIYLALRLGTLDYLDEGREKLPLVLDEALVHWDHDRRASLYAVLKNVAKKRQVILFTCHQSFATEVQEAMGARLIQLPNRMEPQE
jgi:uncharacterized protein YhaN